MLVNPPESDAVLEQFVRKVRPPDKALLRQRFGVTPLESLGWMFQRFVLASAVLFGGLLSTGGFLLHQQLWGWSGLVALVVKSVAAAASSCGLIPSKMTSRWRLCLLSFHCPAGSNRRPVALALVAVSAMAAW